jgi:SAM-dependent methyltransferase
MEEIALFRPPPGALLNVGLDGFDIIETARLYGWQSSSETGQYGTHAEQSQTPCATCISEEEFDVVRLQGSLERVDDPVAFLEQMSGILRRNGVLVVSLPDFSGWEDPLYGEGPALWPVDLPKWFFTPQTLEHLLAAAGYTTLKVTTFTATAHQPIGTDLSSYHTDQALPINLDEDGIISSGQRIPYFRVIARREEKRAAATRKLAARQPHPSRKSHLMETLL